MTWPPALPKMPAMLRVLFEAIIARIDAGWPISGIGIDAVDAEGGRSINLRRQPIGGNGGVVGSDRNPLDPYDASTTTAGSVVTKKVGITYGTIAGLELDGYGPGIITATTFFYAKVTVDEEGAPVGPKAELEARSTLRVPEGVDDTFLSFYTYLGKAVVAGGIISEVLPNLTGSQGYERCGFEDDYQHNTWVI